MFFIELHARQESALDESCLSLHGAPRRCEIPDFFPMPPYACLPSSMVVDSENMKDSAHSLIGPSPLSPKLLSDVAISLRTPHWHTVSIFHDAWDCFGIVGQSSASDSGPRCDRSIRALALPSSIRYCQRQNPIRRLPRVFTVICVFLHYA